MLNYLIVGQGIAGSMLSWFLLKSGKTLLIIDDYDPSSSSNIAAGITNPITGRRFVKTWMADDIIPFADKTYRSLEQELSRHFYTAIPIIKLFDSVKALNDWSARCATDEYAAYLKNERTVHLDSHKVKNDFGGFEISGGSRLDVAGFLLHYRNFLRAKNMFLEKKFLYDELRLESDSVRYKDIEARKIIFCEGANAVNNPWFGKLPFVLAKGECLTIKMNDFYSDRIINGDVMIMPCTIKDEYYIGATHRWHYNSAMPSENGKYELLTGLSTFLKWPFEIIKHNAAIRPTVKDRRPFIGLHARYPQLGIFNGMGTKGISLAPYFAAHFVEHLERGGKLLKEVDIKRFLF